MSKTNEDKLIPKLRFPEFQKQENWELATIGEIGSFYYGKSAPKWSLSSDAPTLCVRYGELYTKFDTIISKIISRTNIEPSNLKFSKGGEILVPRVGEVPQDFAKNCCYLPFPNIAIGEMISVYETKEYPIFYAYYFRTLVKQFAEVVEGQNVKNLYFVNLEPIAVGKPSYLEQQKIADCLSSLDEVIKVQCQKLESLKQHKKGLLQNLFPQEGETLPRLRFNEFVNDGKWEEQSIGDITISQSSSMALNKLKFKQDGYPVYGADSIVGYIEDFQQKERYISIVKDGSGVGRLKLCDSHSSILGTLICLKSKNKNLYDLSWIYYFLNTFNFSIYVKGSGIPHIYYSDFKNGKIAVPKPKEQHKIADCLSALDSLITAQSEKVDQLTLHKTALMQGLFPKIIE
jgi:type I restriction enzyme S subunit